MSARSRLKIPPLVAPCAPEGDTLTDYDRSQILTYARLLDAERDGFNWAEAATEILLLDVATDAAAAKQCWQSHLDRARWFVAGGFST